MGYRQLQRHNVHNVETLQEVVRISGFFYTLVYTLCIDFCSRLVPERDICARVKCRWWIILLHVYARCICMQRSIMQTIVHYWWEGYNRRQIILLQFIHLRVVQCTLQFTVVHYVLVGAL